MRALLETVRSSIERDASCRVVDLHIWTVAPGIHSAIISVVTTTPRNASFYKERLPASLSLKHISIEVFYPRKYRNNFSSLPACPIIF